MELLMVVLTLSVILLFVSILLHIRQLTEKTQVLSDQVVTLLRAITTTQNSLKVRRRGDDVQPNIPRPKAGQHYAGTGVPRTAQGEGTSGRVGKVERHWAGGKPSDPRRGGHVEGDTAAGSTDGSTKG